MDQFVCCQGQAGHALLLDCRSLEYRALRVPARMHLVICNTMVKHKLQGSEYNDRRSECEEAVRRLAKILPSIRSLRDVTLQQLTQHRGQLSETLYKRCRHVITQNERVRKAADALEFGESGVLYELVGEAHDSLRDGYQGSSRELDIMVGVGRREAGVYGGRMRGGGFGG